MPEPHHRTSECQRQCQCQCRLKWARPFGGRVSGDVPFSLRIRRLLAHVGILLPDSVDYLPPADQLLLCIWT